MPRRVSSWEERARTKCVTSDAFPRVRTSAMPKEALLEDLVKRVPGAAAAGGGVQDGAAGGGGGGEEPVWTSTYGSTIGNGEGQF